MHVSIAEAEHSTVLAGTPRPPVSDSRSRKRDGPASVQISSAQLSGQPSIYKLLPIRVASSFIALFPWSQACAYEGVLTSVTFWALAVLDASFSSS